MAFLDKLTHLTWVSQFFNGGFVLSSTEHEQDSYYSYSFQLCCNLIDQTVLLLTKEDTYYRYIVVTNATTKKDTKYKIQKHFQNVMLVGIASGISKHMHI